MKQGTISFQANNDINNAIRKVKIESSMTVEQEIPSLLSRLQNGGNNIRVLDKAVSSKITS